MSAKHPRGPRWTVLATTVAGLLLLGGRAQAGDLDKVAAQKAVADIQKRLAEARKHEATAPEKAKAILNIAEFDLDDAKGLSASQRADLKRQIDDGLKRIAQAPREREQQAKDAADREYTKQKQEAGKREFEQKGKASSGVGQINDAIKTGKQALMTHDQLKKQNEKNFVAMGVADAKTFAGKVEERFTKAYLWRLEHGIGSQKLTPAERDLLKALTTTVSVDFKNHTLKQVIEYLQDKTQGKLNIFVDELSLKEADVEYDTQVTFAAKKTQVQTVLKTILANNRLTYVIKEAAVHVMTPAKAKDHTVLRAYPISDLLGGTNPQFGSFIARAQQAQAAQVIMQIIVSQIEPASWQVNGGTGTIMYEPNSGSLIIRNTAEWHYQMSGAFYK
ncbi:MAG TPA: hypothetical protein VEL76_24410 [Gemmataceae bacterium]|nr:hypothetical protein [Gemmataceae bacterium]